MLSEKQREFVQTVDDKLAETLQSKSGPEMVLNTVACVVRSAHISRTLILQRHTVFADASPLPTTVKVLHAVGLGASLIGLSINGREIARRVRADQSLLAIEPIEKIEPDRISNAAVDFGFSYIRGVQGRTLFKKRQLSTYGRAYAAFGASIIAARLGLHLYAAAKR